MAKDDRERVHLTKLTILANNKEQAMMHQDVPVERARWSGSTAIAAHL